MTKVNLNVNQQKANIASDVLPGENVQTVGTQGRVLKSDATDTFTKSTFVPSDKKSGIISITVGTDSIPVATEKSKVKSLKAEAEAKAKAKAMAQQQAEISANDEARAIERVTRANAKDVAFAERNAEVVNKISKPKEPDIVIANATSNVSSRKRTRITPQSQNTQFYNLATNRGQINGKEWNYGRTRDGHISREDAIAAFTSDEYSTKYADTIKTTKKNTKKAYEAARKEVKKRHAVRAERAKALAPTTGEPGGSRMIADAFRKAEEVAAQVVDKAKKTVPQATETAKKSSNKVIAGIAIALAVLGGALGIKHVNDKNQNKFDVAA